jgi:hypothetical protein
VSADTSGIGRDQVPRDDRRQPVERAGAQLPNAEVPQQPAETRSRAEYNAARHAEPPIRHSWLSVTEADRTVGDTTPTGIGLKPTGEQLRDMESDNPSRSHLDRLLDRALDRADDIHDAAGENAEAITAFRHPDSALPAHQAYTGHAGRDHPQPQGQPVNDMVGSTVVVTVAALAGIRLWLEHRRKEHEP